MNASHSQRCLRTRRNFLLQTAACGAAASSGTLLSSAGEADAPVLSGNAEHVISIWLGGGMGQIDTFDPKRQGDPKSKKPGSYYRSIDTAVEGVQLAEHLHRLAPLMDRVTAVRTVHHDVIDEHAAATNRMHTGRPISGTITYPSLGSIIAHERGTLDEAVPPYVLIGYPNITRGPGFLGARHGYLYLTETGQGPAGLSRRSDISTSRQRRRENFLAALRQKNTEQGTDEEHRARRIADYDVAITQSLKLSGPEFQRVFQLEDEPSDLRNAYGGEFGQRCLLSRRLVERGVRFIEVSHNLNFLNGSGWDVHNEGIEQQHRLIQELDSAFSTLITDLERKKLLDKTLLVITTEFGRPPQFDSGGGRGHQAAAFTCVLAGGGLHHRGAFGTTDELSQKAVGERVSIPDFFATILGCIGVDYTKSLYAGERPVPITDNGRAITSLFS